MRQLLVATIMLSLGVALGSAGASAGYVYSHDDFVDLSIPLVPEASINEGRNSPGQPTPYTQVGTVDGQPFRFYRDGSGSFGKKTDDSYGDDTWHTSCSVDQMDDTRSCYMSKGELGVYITDNGGVWVSVGHEHYPGTGVKVRIDEKKPESAGEDGWSSDHARALIQRLKSADKVTTRFQKWPYERHLDKTIVMDGFALAWRYINWAVKRQQ